jgi:NAD(P)-dependent dehydrogenase (short-subunit alcohol dehydrogenase family)
MFADKTCFQIRPAAKSLKFKATGSYLIVGGLKGLCGSLALFLARQGARRLVVLSRSGYGDNSSKSVLADLSSLGTNVDLIQGDVTMIEDVRRAFAQASAPICGIIQGAMVLRVSQLTTFELQL